MAETQETVTPVENETVEVTVDDLFVESISRAEENVKRARDELSSLKSLRRAVAKTTKTKKKRRVNTDPNRAPSGFARPIEISPELSKFLGTTAGELVARTEVIRRINSYIKEHNLQNDADKRKIDLSKEGGEQLSSILPSEAQDKKGNTLTHNDLTYFNLQTFLRGHFVKNRCSSII